MEPFSEQDIKSIIREFRKSEIEEIYSKVQERSSDEIYNTVSYCTRLIRESGAFVPFDIATQSSSLKNIFQSRESIMALENIATLSRNKEYRKIIGEDFAHSKKPPNLEELLRSKKQVVKKERKPYIHSIYRNLIAAFATMMLEFDKEFLNFYLLEKGVAFSLEELLQAEFVNNDHLDKEDNLNQLRNEIIQFHLTILLCIFSNDKIITKHQEYIESLNIFAKLEKYLWSRFLYLLLIRYKRTFLKKKSEITKGYTFGQGSALSRRPLKL